VDVRIDSLVLRGFTRDQQEAVAASLRIELQRVLGAAAGAGAFQHGGSSASVRLGEVRAPREGLAGRIGQLVADGVTRETRR
jgi:hypothetical protein